MSQHTILRRTIVHLRGSRGPFGTPVVVLLETGGEYSSTCLFTHCLSERQT